jgi:hypothetical protein
MIGRSRRGIRQASMKARIGIAAAVLVGGGAIGAVAVAASSHSTPTAAQSAGYTLNFRHPISQQDALSAALSSWAASPQRSMQALARMAPVKNFIEVRKGHTVFAAQRGVVALATKHWLLVKSANGSLHLWLLNGKTAVKNVANSAVGTAAMTGSTAATNAAMQQNNMAPAAAVMAGAANVAAMNATPRPVTFTVAVTGTNVTLTITITPSTATVAPTTMTGAQAMSAQTGTAMTMAPAKQPVFAATSHIARGDLVLVTGVVKNHFLWAQLVLFSKPVMVTPAPSVSPTVTPTATATGTVAPTPTGTAKVPVTVTSTPPTFGGGKS